LRRRGEVVVGRGLQVVGRAFIKLLQLGRQALEQVLVGGACHRSADQDGGQRQRGRDRPAPNRSSASGHCLASSQDEICIPCLQWAPDASKGVTSASA